MFILTLKLITAIGAVNWGLIGLFDFNLVTYLFANYPTIKKIIYVIVGVSGLGVISRLYMDQISDKQLYNLMED